MNHATTMQKKNWLSDAVFVVVSVASVGMLLTALGSTLTLPWPGQTGLFSWLGLLLIILAVSRFTVSVNSNDGESESKKSVADTFVFLAVMLFAIPPANTPGPAIVLAGVVAFLSTFRFGNRRQLILTTAIAIISTSISASCYSLLVAFFTLQSELVGQRLPINIFLIPLCVLALLQYFLSTLATSTVLKIDTGQKATLPSQESIVWTITAQLAAASSAVLFYSAIHGAGLPYALLGFLITVLIYLLYLFNEKRVDEVRRAEAHQRRHIEEMATIHMNTIESLAIAIDAKDQTTHGHVRRTQIYAQKMGELLKVSDLEVKALVAGALLHDIGKLAVPEYILNKPGKLTEAEFAKMKIHPTVGGDILRRVNFPYPVEDIVRYHHEKWDGSGYPKGLRQEQIPLVARIISVVDFYDATRCDRPYRKGMKREESLALLQSMAGNAFDPRVVNNFVANVEMFDRLIAKEDIREQVHCEEDLVDYATSTRPDAGLASDTLGAANDTVGFRSISEAQREVFALHEIAQTIGSSLNISDTVTLVTNKLRSIVPFDTCIIFTVDEKSGKAVALHVAGDDAAFFKRRRVDIGDGITGWVVANSRSMCNASPELDLVGVPDEIAKAYRGILVSPLTREDGSFGAITLLSKSRTTYTTEHVRLLESVCQHASSALNNALTFEKTKESALVDPLTELPNARAFYMLLGQRIAECQRMDHESLAVICMDLDDFKAINDEFGHAIGDRVLASIAGVIRKELRQMDVLARYAGDEFVIIMPMASEQMAHTVVDRIRIAVEAQKFSVRAGKTVQLGLSLGLACFPAAGETTEELLTSAASAMQRDKHRRKTILTVAGAPIGAIGALR
jgi:diguanylate cyclase (GGDEF)-like protein/putative nucleotidyltransferase with HDIG domain